MIQSFEFDGLGRQIDARGFFFVYDAGSDSAGEVRVAVVADGQPLGVLKPGDALRLTRPVKRWEVRPVSNGCTGVVRVGEAELLRMDEVRRTPADVSRSGAAFCGVGLAVYDAGGVPCVQLWNTSSDRRLIVTQVRMSTSTGGNFYVGILSSQTPGQRVAMGRCKNGTGSSTAGQIRGGQPAVPPADMDAAVDAGVTFGGMALEFRPAEPWVIEPGRGLAVWGDAAGVDLITAIHWVEEKR